jgi:hypothetical protein
MLQFANTINGRFVEYTGDKHIILVPIERNRCQAVVSQMVEKNGAMLVEFYSKVGELTANRDSHQVILKINQELLHSRVVIQDWQLKIFAEVLHQGCTEQFLQEVIFEVATVAYHLDHQEVSLPQEAEITL